MPEAVTSADLDLVGNPLADRKAEYGPAEREVVSLANHRRAREEIESWPGYRPTPLVSLPALARRGRVADVRVKDEGGRFGLGSFKALGGAYGVLRVVAAEVARRTGEGGTASEDLLEGRHAEAAAAVTVTCATDGNHGRAVAWGAELVGCGCVVYVPDHVTPARERAIASHGARVVRVRGSYDDAVERADREAREEGRVVISDTAYPGYEEIPRTVMQGYTVMVAEILDRLEPEETPTHVFIPGGVGGLAAAVTGHLWERLGDGRPRIVVVEPKEADGLYQSALAGEPRSASGSLETVMGGLSCRRVSPVAWTILRTGGDAFLRIPDSAAPEAMRVLAAGRGGDPPVVAGETGAAATAGFLRAAGTEETRAALGLGEGSRVLLPVTEGATDPGRYRSLVGRDPEEVRGGSP